MTATARRSGQAPRSAGLEIHALDLECQAAAAAAAKQLFAWLRAERPPGFVERIGRSQWPWRSEAETLRHGDVLTVEQCKCVLGHKFPILHNVVTDLEHGAAPRGGSWGLGRGACILCSWSRGVGVALQLETRVQPGDAVFWLPVVGVWRWTWCRRSRRRWRVSRACSCGWTWRRGACVGGGGDALQRWAFGVPFGEGVGVRQGG